ncbi:17470_t:CDS:2, partial [Entrophospora sp. SA101]
YWALSSLFDVGLMTDDVTINQSSSCLVMTTELGLYLDGIHCMQDSETAASAVRNLNNVEVGGRQLRVDYADNDPATSSNSSNNSSHQARALLAQNPQLCYALFQIMLDQNIVDPNILRLMQQSSLQGQTQPQPTAVQNTNPLVTPNYGSQPIPNTAQIPQQHQPN